MNKGMGVLQARDGVVLPHKAPHTQSISLSQWLFSTQSLPRRQSAPSCDSPDHSRPGGLVLWVTVHKDVATDDAYGLAAADDVLRWATNAASLLVHAHS